MNDFLGYSETDIVREMGRRFRNCRQIMRRRQEDIAFQSGISVHTIRNFENGAATNITLVTFLRLMDAIHQRPNIDAAIPDLPDINEFHSKPVQRIKPRKDER